MQDKHLSFSGFIQQIRRRRKKDSDQSVKEKFRLFIYKICIRHVNTAFWIFFYAYIFCQVLFIILLINNINRTFCQWDSINQYQYWHWQCPPSHDIFLLKVVVITQFSRDCKFTCDREPGKCYDNIWVSHFCFVFNKLQTIRCFRYQGVVKLFSVYGTLRSDWSF